MEVMEDMGVTVLPGRGIELEMKALCSNDERMPGR
jgi:hypothetical protein